MAGEYRTEAALTQLPDDVATQLRTGHLRLALTDQPMTGVTRRPDLVEPLAKLYDKVKGMERYAANLRAGKVVPVNPVSGPNKVWAPGELFLTS